MMQRRILICFIGLLLTILTINSLLAAPSLTPILRLEANRHVSPIKRMAVDQRERYAVTSSEDKTVRVWDIRKQGRLLRTIRPPIGQGDEGELYAVAISPDGELIAAGSREGEVYIFRRSDGHLLRRIHGLPSIILDLDFSDDGSKLALSLGGRHGIRVYDPSNNRLLASDKFYFGQSDSVDFNYQGRLVSTSADGQVRLYDASLRLLKRYRTKGGKQPTDARFSADARSIAVGFKDSTAVEVLAAHDLSSRISPDTTGINNGNLSTVAWSADGRWVYAAGNYDYKSGNPLVMLPIAGGKRRLLNTSQKAVTAIHPLRDGGVLFASTDPTLGRLDASGKTIWRRTSGALTFQSGQEGRNFKLDAKGEQIWVQYAYEREYNGQIVHGQVGWDIGEQVLLKTPSFELQSPRLKGSGLQITHWENKYYPKLNGRVLPLKQGELSRSLAITRNERSFVLGTEWYLRYFEANGKQRWEKPVPISKVVNISQNGRWVVAALGDGTIRWYQADTGKERLAFYLHPDQQRWVAWTPEGFYTASSDQAERLIGYHLNNGSDKTAHFVWVDRLKKVYARADLVARALEHGFPKMAQAALSKVGDIRRFLRADRLPPEIRVVGGKKVFYVKQRHFKLPLKIVNQGGGLTRVEYRLNGELLPRSKVRSGGFIGLSSQQETSLTPEFTLSNGSHKLEITAYGLDGKVPSQTISVTAEVNNPAQRIKPTLHVLSIGVSKYKYRSHRLNLPFAAPDAEAIHQAFQGNRSQGLHHRVNAKLLINDAATSNNIRLTIAEMAKQVHENDVFILYMSGHGKSLDAEYHFLPHELQFSNLAEFRKRTVNGSKLAQWLKPIKAQKRLMLLDTCNAGQAALQIASALQLDDQISRIRSALDDELAVMKLKESVGLSIMAASTSRDIALEGITNRKTGNGHGLFTYSLLEGLDGAADSNRNTFISVGELDAYIKRRVPALSRQKWKYEQTPMSVTSGDFTLVKR